MSIFVENNFEAEKQGEEQIERCIMKRNNSLDFYYKPSANEFIIKLNIQTKNLNGIMKLINLL